MNAELRRLLSIYLSSLISMRLVSEYISYMCFGSKFFSHHDIIVLMLLYNPNMSE